MRALRLATARVPRRTLVRTSPRAHLDFQLFRDFTAPALRAGYLGASLYFALQWAAYRDLTRRRTDDVEPAAAPPDDSESESESGSDTESDRRQ